MTVRVPSPLAVSPGKSSSKVEQSDVMLVKHGNIEGEGLTKGNA